MKHIFFVLFLLLCNKFAFAQPANDNCSGALVISNVFNFCSDNAAYTTVGASPSFGTGNDVWFVFTALASEVTINITGNTDGGGTLLSPSIEMFIDCSGNRLTGSLLREANLSTYNKGGLIFGRQYLIQVSGTNSGTFKLCLNNYTPIAQPGQDLVSASLLCSKSTFTQLNVTGPGADANESRGSCLDIQGQANEQNSAWYKWTAANNGTLAFTIIPTANDDIDWVLYDLGTVTQPVSLANAQRLRCAASRGIDCPEPYFKNTGMSLTATDIEESGGCGPGKDGFVRFIDMQKDHVYALLVNNFDRGNNGFTLEFNGTGEFVGPKAPISFTANNPCQAGQTFTISATPNAEAATLNWTFGSPGDFTIVSSSGNTYTIAYNSSGTKVIGLEITSATGCQTVETRTFDVGTTPLPPIITSNKTQYCTGDTIILSATDIPGVTYTWTGPGNFVGSGQILSVPVTNLQQGGNYTVFITDNGCKSDLVTITIPPILKNPLAAFRTDPVLPAKLAFPVTVRFFNQSTDADTYLWDFGDGSTSTDTDPEHTYTAVGDYTVTLTAFKQDVCNSSVMHGKFVVRADNTIFIPNTFTPNGDGVNDELVVTLINIRNYHIRIYNRWGVPLFESVSIFDNWKGTFRQEAVPVGTYYYLITAIDSAGDEVKRSGSVTVVR